MLLISSAYSKLVLTCSLFADRRLSIKIMRWTFSIVWLCHFGSDMLSNATFLIRHES